MNKKRAPRKSSATKKTATRRKAVYAHEFYLVDDAGRTRGILGTFDSEGNPALKLFDEEHCGRVSIGLEKNGAAHMSCMNANGQVVVGLGVGADGRCGLSLADANGELAALVVVHPDGARQIHLFDRSGRTVEIRDW